MNLIFFPYIIFLLVPLLRQENPSSHGSASVETQIGCRLWLCWSRWQSLGTQCCTALHVSSPQAGETQKPEPFPGRNLAPAKISPVFWINRALQGYQYLWINVFEGRERAFIIIHSAQPVPTTSACRQCKQNLTCCRFQLQFGVLGSIP